MNTRFHLLSRQRLFQHPIFQYGGLLSLVVLLIAILIVFLFRSTPLNEFPDLGNGAFTGTISGLDSAERTLYVERLSANDSLLFLVFQKDWKPEMIPLRPLDTSQSSDSKKLSPGFQPIEVKTGAESLRLIGSGDGKRFSGDVLRGDETIGSWKLSSIELKTLRGEDDSSALQFDLNRWLRLEGDRRTLSNAVQSLRETNKDRTQKLELLTRYVSNSDELRERANLRKSELATEIAGLIKEQESAQKELKDLVRELEQLSRITRRGQTIELARRVLKRENKWYEVHWQTDQEGGSLEQKFADKLNIDTAKLEQRYRQAKEIESLKNQILEEQNKIIRLQQGGPQRGPEPAAPGNEDNRQAPDSDGNQKPWWQKLDSVFG